MRRVLRSGSIRSRYRLVPDKDPARSLTLRRVLLADGESHLWDDNGNMVSDSRLGMLGHLYYDVFNQLREA